MDFQNSWGSPENAIDIVLLVGTTTGDILVN